MVWLYLWYWLIMLIGIEKLTSSGYVGSAVAGLSGYMLYQLSKYLGLWQLVIKYRFSETKNSKLHHSRRLLFILHISQQE